jgi:iron complex outermembrane receptor protein
LNESSTASHRLSLLAARGFRIPTLNELYWNPGGNLDLVPEESYSAELGYKGEITNKNNFTYEITAYRMWVSNWILWQPDGSIWSPQNIREVDVYGLEFSGNLSHQLGQAKLDWHGNYGFTRSVNRTGLDQFDRSVGKQLSYTPIHKGSLTGNLQVKTWSLLVNTTAIGQRFTTADNENYLPAYMLVNVKASKNINLGKHLLNLSLTVNNLLDVSYQSVENRAMPGINYLFGLKLFLHNPI